MGALLNALREEGTKEEILDALAEKITERDELVKQVATLRAALKEAQRYQLQLGIATQWGRDVLVQMDAALAATA